MEPKQILSASLLDLVFDDRNKQYGAYELRVTYPERIKKSLLFTFTIALLAFTGAVMANSFKPKESGMLAIKEVTISDIKPDEKKPEPLPEEKKPEPKPEVRTEKLTEFKIVDKDVVEPPPTQEDLLNAKVDDIKNEGVVYDGTTVLNELDDDKGIIEAPKTTEPAIFTIVEVDAKFNGNWEKFLIKNLDPDVPVEKGAPAGRYRVVVQFVVDIDGSISDIKPLTNYGYGMEQEAIRVLKKATKWEPAYQNNRHVKAYRSQPITFEVMDNE